jgi:phosphoribosylformylglycinamidine synthase
MLAVCESARNVACSGAEPVGVTDCLNFGNPEKPEIMWQFRSAIEGMAKACDAFHVPVVSGNVSFYNETKGKGINPTPTVAMVGLLEDVSTRLVQWFRGEGDLILLAGADRDEVELGGSLYLNEVHGKVAGTPPEADPAHEARLCGFLRAAASLRLLSSAHDLAEGGLACALAEACVTRPDGPVGARIGNPFPESIRADFAMFSENQGRVLLSCAPDKKTALLATAAEFRITMKTLGVVGGTDIEIEGIARVDAQEMKSVWAGGLDGALGLGG